MSHAIIYVTNEDVGLNQEIIPKSSPINWLRRGVAVEVILDGKPDNNHFAELRENATLNHADIFLIPLNQPRRKKLLLADMDATIVEGETLDDLAEIAGIKDEIAQITAQAMRGEIDFKDALLRRVAKLKDMHVTALTQTLNNMQLTSGARDMVKVMRASGAKCVLVSGGFTFFTSAIADKCGFNFNHGNVLEIIDDKLTGNVISPILDKDAKLNYLKQYTAQFSLLNSDTMAVGDGSNDIPMLIGAGLGIGYKPKPLVKEHVQNCIIYSDHISLLYMQGYNWDEIQDIIRD